MQKIMMPTEETKNFLEVFELFVILQSAKGVADVTKRDIETMVASMRKAGVAHNSIVTYMRMLSIFYNWCNAGGFYFIRCRKILISFYCIFGKAVISYILLNKCSRGQI